MFKSLHYVTVIFITDKAEGGGVSLIEGKFLYLRLFKMKP